LQHVFVVVVAVMRTEEEEEECQGGGGACLPSRLRRQSRQGNEDKERQEQSPLQSFLVSSFLPSRRYNCAAIDEVKKFGVLKLLVDTLQHHHMVINLSYGFPAPIYSSLYCQFARYRNRVTESEL
jgi:hypothetical protein